MSVRAIARELGVSATAVSLALQHSPRVSAALREQVRRAAKAHGHVPNARLAELMSEVRRSTSPGYRGALGVIALFPEERPWIERPAWSHLGELVAGAAETAAGHGYKLEHFWLKEPGMTPRRLAQIVEARGVRGLFCLGSLDPEEAFPAELRTFAVVTQGASIPDGMHRVVSHFAADARLLYEQLLRRGYRRPGLLIQPSADRRTDYLYTATFLGHCERHGHGETPVPVLRGEAWDEAAFAAWFERHRPDAIVLHHAPETVAALGAWLAKRGVKVPRDVGVALLDRNPDRARYAGVCQDPKRMGAVAVELLLGRLLLQDVGPPAWPKVELVTGRWNEGRTLRRSPRGG